MNVRVDVWIWAARLAKTRSQATDACKAGHIKLNDETAKPAQKVKIGDVVRARLHRQEKIYEVTGFASKRGSAEEAAALFNDLTPPPLPKAEKPMEITRERGTGRPTKKERRDLDRLRGYASF